MSQDFNWDDVKRAADHAVFDRTGRHLSDIEIKVLEGSWHGKTYDQMASLHGYSTAYLNQDIGNQLWKTLSDALREKVTKKSFREALIRAWSRHAPSPKPMTSINPTALSGCLSYPTGAVPLNSPMYLERSHIEPICFSAILEPGALIRIKAPQLMGKTSLMTRIFAAAAENCRSVYLDLRSCDRSIFVDSERFLRWICAKVARQLRLQDQLNDYWDTDILGNNDNCTAYFEEYVLPNIEEPIVLGIDDCDRLFTHPDIAEDVLGLLRSWHEKGKVSPIWQQLRLMIAHSTEVYIPLDINQSPFNVGLPVELPEFDVAQVQTLVERHNLTLNPHQIKTLMQMVGGHPYLIRLALYTLCSSNLTLEALLEHAPTQAGIYSDHLRGHLETLDRSPELIPALQQVVTTDGPVELDPKQTYKLCSMGLVHQINNAVLPRCTLYRSYFSRVMC
ncbi:MAG: AAA-like domain-containing protein [Cyanobacteria bacterium P01_F01_bin.150]